MSAEQEEDKQFVISAHVVRQLGDQLVSDEVTALIELVKNAYDADAKSVSIIVDTKNAYSDEILVVYPEQVILAVPAPEDSTLPAVAIDELRTDSVETDDLEDAQKQEPLIGFIQIKDTGTGMDDNDVTKGWLHISFSVKRNANQAGYTTPRFGRSFLGSKGVGRLSAQRIGNRLDLFSFKEYYIEETKKWQKAEVGVQVGINWSDFKENVRLQDVKVHFQQWMPKNARTGTKLVITDLQNPEAWQKKESRDALVSKLAQLISPFEPAKDFRIDLQIENQPYNLLELTKGVRDTAISSYTFKFTGKELIITGKIKLSLFRGGNSAQDAYDYQLLLAADKGADFFEFLTQSNNADLTQCNKESPWYLEYNITYQASSLNLVSSFAEQGENSPTTTFQNPGEFHGEIDQLAYENDEVDSSKTIFSQTGEYKAYVKRQAGVRIYRDGFGIRPYGIDGDDWIGFQAGTTSGKSFYGLRPKNIIGYISITAKTNAVLEEKTDREGFVINPASQNFFIITYKVRDEINGLMNRIRRRFTDYKRERSIEVGQISSPAAVFSNLRDSATRAVTIRQKSKETNIQAIEKSISDKLKAIRETPLLESANDGAMHRLLEEAQIELGKAREILALIEEMHEKMQYLEPEASYLESQLEQLRFQLSDYTQLAAVGMTAEALTHEINNIVDVLLEEAQSMSTFLKKHANTSTEVLLFVERVRSSMHALRRQTQHLDPSLRYLREKREVIDMPAFIVGIQDFYESRLRFQETGVKIIIKDSSNGFKIFCSRGKITQALDNLLINAEYWLRESIQQNAISVPHIVISLDKPYIEIHDNGIGIDPGIIPHLFQPFVTTKPRDVGRGLGLFITNQLLESMGCTIEVLPTLNRFKRPFIFRIDLTGILHD